ncbi:MAG TPA: hypothetical protein EYG85_06735 [Crocinitomix sp.]|nr:hypothetical protein [Crocinitomix sp.]
MMVFRKIFTFLKKLLFWVFFISLFTITLVTIFLKIYEDDIEQYAINEINKHLNTKVIVQDIDLTFIRNFPYASLDFQKILINDAYESIKSEDTLFYAEHLYLNFNVWDILSENYTVKNVKANNGVLKIKTSKRGDVNYLITKPANDSTSSDHFSFKLDWLQAQDLRFEYANIATQQFYKININQGDFEGDFSETNYQLKVRSDLYIKKLKTNSFSLVKQKKAHLDLNLQIDTDKKEYVFKQGDLTIGKMQFQLTGHITDHFIDLNIKGENIDLDDLSKTILNQNVEQANNYEGYGKVDFDAKIKGKLEKTIMPSITADFSINNGKITKRDNGLSLTNIKLIGNYKNKQKNRSEILSFETLSFNLLKSTFDGNTVIVDFNTPTFVGDISANIDLASFHQFFKFNTVEILSGNVKLNTSYSIRFPDIEYNPSLFDLENTNGEMVLQNVSFKPYESDVFLTKISANILLRGNDMATKNLSFKSGKSDFLLNGALKNIIPFIEGTADLGIIATIESNLIDINEFLKFDPTKTKEKSIQQPFVFPDNINLNIDLDIKELLWDNHHFTNIKGKFFMFEQVAKVKNFSLQTLEGVAKGNIKLENDKNSNISLLDGQLTLKNINVKQLFAEWKNFDQKIITEQHLSGTLNGSFDLLLVFDQYLTFLEDKMYVKSNLTIKNGELNNVKTMLEITEYMRSNKALKLALNKHIDHFENKIIHLKFSDLTNTITIKDRKVFIPKMLIKTNALDVEFSGWHDFDNNIEYHFSFRFRDLKTMPQYTEFGKIEDDGLGWRVYITMSGNIDNPDYSLDKTEMKTTIKESLTDEKQNIKSILKSEFGLFKKDSTVQEKTTNNKSEAVEFIFYDEDDPNSNKTDTITKKNKKKTNKFFNKLKQDTQTEEKVEIEIE